MYFPNDIEEICYDPDHIKKVLSEIILNFPRYFQNYLEQEAGQAIPISDIEKLAKSLGTIKLPKKKPIDKQNVYNRLLNEAIVVFESDRTTYKEILDEAALEEYADDPSSFKNTILKNKCPIIRHTLQNKLAKELDKYREAFKYADPKDLVNVSTNIANFARTYARNDYESESYEESKDLTDMNFSDLTTDDYTVFGVIGGGIKSIFLYKLYPNIFPYRGPDAIWSLWYLTNKKTFGCHQDSEFLMIKQEDNTTQQNFYYPYDLFAFYALQIFNLVKLQAMALNVEIRTNYRFVMVDSFLSFVANFHRDEINDLKRKVTLDWHGY